MPTLATAHQLANTYPPVNEVAAWSRVQEYRRVTEYTAHHPNQGSSAVATALGLPRARIRAWVDADGMPDPVRAIDKALSRGWLDIDADTTHGRPWVQLVAWVYSGGSISHGNHEATFFVREHNHGLNLNELDVLRTVLDDIGVGHQVESRNAGRATHIIPGENRVLVGRLLDAMGAPVGEKHADRHLELPSWLWESNRETQRAFCRVYLLNRATEREHEPRLQVREERTDDYHDQLVELFQQASGLPNAITRSGHNTFLRSEVVAAILD